MIPRKCPECGSRRVAVESKKYNTSKCKNCGYRGDTSEFKAR